MFTVNLILSHGQYEVDTVIPYLTFICDALISVCVGEIFAFSSTFGLIA